MTARSSSEPAPETIQRLADGAMAAHALLAGMQLNVFSALNDAPKDPEILSKVIGADADKLRLLLYALVVAGMLNVKDGIFSNTPEAERYLVEGKSTYIGGRWRSFADSWKNAFNTTESIQSGVAQAKMDFAGMSSEEMEAFLRGLQPSSMASGRTLLENFDFSQHQRLLEVGAGLGGLTLVIAEACPNIHAVLADFPAVTSIALKAVTEANLGDRVNVLPGDAVTDPLGGPYDAVAMKAFIQVLNREQAERALINVGRSTEPGGAIYIIGKIIADTRVEPPDAVLFNINFLNIYDGGQAYTESEYREWLEEAGFEQIQLTHVPGEDSIIRARKQGV